MKRHDEPDMMHWALVAIVLVLATAFMYKCWQMDQLVQMLTMI